MKDNRFLIELLVMTAIVVVQFVAIVVHMTGM